MIDRDESDLVFPIERGRACLREVARRCGGDDLCEVGSDRPAYLWLCGSTMMEALLEADATIVLRAWLVISPRDQRTMKQILAPLSATLGHGRLVVDAEGDLVLLHTIPAGASVGRVDREMRTVCREADQLDDLLCAVLGGVRAVDRFQADVVTALHSEHGVSNWGQA